MSDFTIEIRFPELAEAIRSLAGAQMAATDALNLLAARGFPGTVGENPPAPAHLPEIPAAFDPRPAEFTPARIPPQPIGPASVSPLPPTVTASSGPANPHHSAPLPAHTQAEHGFTLDDLARAASTLMGAGKYMLLVELLGRFGVQALFQLPKEHFGAFAAALRQLGAII